MSRTLVSCIWTSKKIHDEAPLQRSGHAAAILNEEVYIFGGSKYENAKVNESYEVTFFDDMHSLAVKEGCMKWRKVPQYDDVPPPRDSHTMSAVGNVFYLYGGKNHVYVNEAMKGIFRFCPETCIWSSIHATGFAPGAVGHSASVVGTDIYVFGGLKNGRATNSLDKFDTDDMSWNAVVGTGNPPCPRCDHASESVNGVIYVFGGSAGREQWLNDLHCFDTSTKTWSQPVLRGTPPVPRCGHSFVAHRDKDIYVFGGWTNTHGDHLIVTNLKKLSLTNQKWKEPLCAGNCPPEARHSHFAFILHSSLYVLGGMRSNGEAPLDVIHCLQLINPSERRLVLAQALKDLENS